MLLGNPKCRNQRLNNNFLPPKKFAQKWQFETDERREKDSFWNDFFAIFGIDRKKHAHFEFPVKDELGNTQFIDLFYKGIFLAEHKTAGRNLSEAKAQAERYIAQIARRLPHKDLPEFYAVCDFANFHLFRREAVEGGENQWKFCLTELPQLIENGVFNFMLGLENKIRDSQAEANLKAAELIGKLHNAFKAENCYDQHQLRLFITRLLFLFFADDSLVFSRNWLFHDFIEKCTLPDGSDLGEKLNRLFDTVNREKRSPNLPPEYAEFPYINGGLFAENLPVFDFNAKLREQVLECSQFYWANISPEIFGTLFQSVMNSDERREAGAHYTESDNIEKVIDSLFLDDLKAEFAAICKAKSKDKRSNLGNFYQKLQGLRFLDPACGCGNFLIVAYDHLRQLEDEILTEILKDGSSGLFEQPAIQCHLHQFHGIEIDEFASMIARVAMWLKNHQCNRRTFNRFNGEVACETLPLRDEAQILNANSLEVEWAEVDYILGNPPFIGKTYQTATQKADMQRICGEIKGFASLDYVCNWYVKAARQMQSNPSCKTAFVSTNSITQGEQVEILWGHLLGLGVQIFFAHRTFQWTSQASGKAAVHCVIVGFCLENTRANAVRPYEEPLSDENRRGEPRSPEMATRKLFSYDTGGEISLKLCQNINPYLLDAPNLIVGKRKTQVSGEVEMVNGSKVTDGGNLLLTAEEKAELIQSEPLAANYIRPFLGSDEFINGKERYCLWFNDTTETRLNHDLKQMPKVAQRIENVRQMRSASTDKQTKKDAETPHLFQTNRQPTSEHYLLIPSVSSENREYVPIGYLTSDIIVSNLAYTLPNATLYHFGILCSAMHNAFMRTVAGRLKSDYRYSNTIVYNNFPFPFKSASGEKSIAAAAQRVLDARHFYRQEAATEGLPPPTLADFYRPNNPFSRLTKAHKALDEAVDLAYGYLGGNNDEERVAFLFGVLGK